MTIAIQLHINGDGCWPDLPELFSQNKVINLMGNEAPPIELAALPGGMRSGAPSVTIRINLPDGRVVLAETSLALLATSVDAIRAAHGGDRDD